MPNWVSIVISAAAFAVSCASLFISWRMAQRTIDAAKVTGWIELAATGSAEWFVASLSVKNPSHLDIKVEKLGIALPNFRLADIDEASIDDGYGNRVLPEDITVKNHYAAMSFAMAVGAGETSKGKFLIYQPARSRKKVAKLSVMYWTLEPKPKWRILPVTVRTRPDL